MPINDPLRPNVAEEFDPTSILPAPSAVATPLPEVLPQSAAGPPLVPNMSGEFDPMAAMGLRSATPGPSPLPEILPESMIDATTPIPVPLPDAPRPDVAQPDTIGLGPQSPLLPTPALRPAQQLGFDVEATAGNLDRFAAERQRLDARATELRDQALAETDPAKKAELVDRYQAVIGDAEKIGAKERESQSALTDQTTRLGAEVQREQAGFESAALDDIARRRQEINDESAQRETARQEEQSRIETKLESDRAEYREFIKSGGPDAPVIDIGLAEMFSELVYATIERRTPQYGPILARANQKNAALYQRRAKAKLESIGLTGDDLKDSMRLRDQIRTEQRAAEGAMLGEVNEKLQRQLAQAATPLERAQAATALEANRQKQAQHEVASLAAARVADRKARKEEADIALTGAKLGTEEAKAAKLEAEAAKAARRGRGRGGPKTIAGSSPGLIGPTQVTFPRSATDDIAITVGDPLNPTSLDRKKAEKLRAVLTYNAQMLRNINELEASIKDAGTQSVMGTAGFDRSTEWVDLESQISNLVPEISKIGSGGFASTEADQKWAEKNLPSVPNMWNTKAKSLARIRAMKSRVMDRARFAMSNEGVKASLAEDIIKKQSVYSVSRSDVAKQAVADAPKTLVDPEKDVPSRIASIDAIEETARDEAGDDWLGLAAGRISSALPNIKNNQVRQVALEKLDKWSGFAEARVRKSSREGAFPKPSDPNFDKLMRQAEDHGGWLATAAAKYHEDVRVVEQVAKARKQLTNDLKSEIKQALGLDQ